MMDRFEAALRRWAQARRVKLTILHARAHQGGCEEWDHEETPQCYLAHPAEWCQPCAGRELFREGLRAARRAEVKARRAVTAIVDRGYADVAREDEPS